MRTILCYGDSNTWGWDPVTKERHPRHIRWPGRLQANLGEDYYVIEEGLSGRTTVWDDPIEEYKNGKTYLYPCLESHKPLDLVILMLGTNDLKTRFQLSALDVALGAGRLVDIILRSRSGPEAAAPKILLLSPPLIGNLDDTGKELFSGAAEKSRQFDRYYRLVSAEYGCAYLDAAGLIHPSQTEGLHLDADAHLRLAECLAEFIPKLLE